MTATLVFLFGMLAVARPLIQQAVKPGTKDLAEIASGLVQPGDRVFHYHNYFQDFPYYAHQTVGPRELSGRARAPVLRPGRAGGAVHRGRGFPPDLGRPGRVFAVARIRDTPALFGDPAFPYHIVGTSPGHYLFSNQP